MGHKVKWCLRLLSRKNTRPDEVETENPVCPLGRADHVPKPVW